MCFTGSLFVPGSAVDKWQVRLKSGIRSTGILQSMSGIGVAQGVDLRAPQLGGGGELAGEALDDPATESGPTIRLGAAAPPHRCLLAKALEGLDLPVDYSASPGKPSGRDNRSLVISNRLSRSLCE